jgi:hypothetical protein
MTTCRDLTGIEMEADRRCQYTGAEARRKYIAGYATGWRDRDRGLHRIDFGRDNHIWAEGYRAGWTAAQPCDRCTGDRAGAHGATLCADCETDDMIEMERAAGNEYI